MPTGSKNITLFHKVFIILCCIHGTIIRTGTTCKKSVICATQLVGGVLLKM